MSLLEIEGLSKRFGPKEVLADLDLRLEEGEIVSILGGSGVGKSTLFNLISGVLPADSGDIRLRGQSILGQKKYVAYMMQKDLLLPFRTIEDNVCLPLLLAGVSKKAARAEANPLFTDFSLEGCQKLYPSQLSGGMRQRAALLRTYLQKREIALLDEPFSALDALTRGEMHQWYLSLMKTIRLSTLFITHDVNEALSLSDRIYILKGQPARIVENLSVDPTYRRQPEFPNSLEFLQLKQRIFALLEEPV